MINKDTALYAEKLSKLYHIGARQKTYRTIRDSLSDAVALPFQAIRSTLQRSDPGPTHTKHNILWALKDVSFEIKRGEVVGVIGRNGAGKSTLLKVLSRITKPTTGSAEIRGRIGSLLEVGTGFHPELTGRENVFLSGAILGMKRADIVRKFDDIVAFAEVEKMIDTQVKHYSSGMHVRLGFAVAAYLEPDVLLIDEVLAVGDAAFQRKCLGLMQDMRSGGRTVVVVSHVMTTIENLCGRVLWVDEGRIREDGPTHNVIGNYLSAYLKDEAVVDLEHFRDRSGTGGVRIIRVELLSKVGRPSISVRMGEPLTLRITLRPNGYKGNIIVGAYLHSEEGVLVSDFRTNHVGFDAGRILDTTSFDLTIEEISLYPRRYVISPWVMDSYAKEDLDWLKYAAEFTVEPSDFLGTGANLTADFGITYIPSHWNRI